MQALFRSFLNAISRNRHKVGSIALVGTMFLSVLALPNFSTTSPSSNTEDYEMMLQNPTPVLPPNPEDDLVPGTGSLPNFMQGLETGSDEQTKSDAKETEPEETEADEPENDEV